MIVLHLRAGGILYLIASFFAAGRSLTCDGIDCGLGFCIPRFGGGYQCICVDGYEGEHCDTPTLYRRSVTSSEWLDCDEKLICYNGATCVTEAAEGEAPIVESSGECGDGGNCTSCVCPPGFTGARCSERIGKV